MDINNDAEINLITDTIRIQGFVEIKNGETVIHGKNRFVQTMLTHIMNMLSNSGEPSGTFYRYFNLPSNSISMYVGSDISTTTNYNTTALTSQIGTAPNTISGAVSNPLPGVFKLTITATWNPGTVSGTVGEMALYLDTYDSPLQGFGWADNFQPTGNRLASRLAVADRSFLPFSINIQNPLAIGWTIQLSF